MLVRVIVKGKTYVLPASQLVVLTDEQVPVALAYQDRGVIVQSDASDSDFGKMLAELRIGLPAPRVDKVG